MKRSSRTGAPMRSWSGTRRFTSCAGRGCVGGSRWLRVGSSVLVLAANDLQLVGITELPDRIDEGSHVIVDGKVLEGVAYDQHTRFVIQVVSVLPYRPKH